jgi:Tol biopolymer transport system component
MKRVLLSLAAGLLVVAGADAKRVKIDLSVVDVPEEGGVSFERITEDADCVFSRYLVRKGANLFGVKNSANIDWWVNPQIALSPDGQRLAYINDKNNTTNIMVKDARKGGASTQRTFRTNVEDFTWSPDGSTICFTELRNGHHGVYLVDAAQGNVVRQISNSNDNDYAGKISSDNNTIYFHRGEGSQSFSIWSYDRKTNLFSNYSRGMTPCLDPRNPDVIYCARYTNNKESEIWRINTKTGVEEIILSQQARSFTTPQLSPDGQWLLVTGTSMSEKDKLINTDIFAVRVDGTQFTQLTYHPGNDISAVWAPDGKNIFFLSQRGSKDGVYNVWKMAFVL